MNFEPVWTLDIPKKNRMGEAEAWANVWETCLKSWAPTCQDVCQNTTYSPQVYGNLTLANTQSRLQYSLEFVVAQKSSIDCLLFMLQANNLRDETLQKIFSCSQAKKKKGSALLSDYMLLLLGFLSWSIWLVFQEYLMRIVGREYWSTPSRGGFGAWSDQQHKFAASSCRIDAGAFAVNWIWGNNKTIALWLVWER